MTEAFYNWFVEPKNKYTNSVVGHQMTEENSEELKNEDGKNVSVWRCNWRFAHMLNQSRRFDKDLSFQLYNSRTSHGPIRKCVWATLAKKAKAKIGTCVRS